MKKIDRTLVSACLALVDIACGDSGKTERVEHSGGGDDETDASDAASAASAVAEDDAGDETLERDGGTAFDAGDAADTESTADAAEAMDGGEEEHDVSPPAAAATQVVVIRFKAKVGQEDFACGRTYAGQGMAPGTTVEPLDFRFFVQDLRLINSEGEEVSVVLDTIDPWQSPTLALIDFEDATGMCVDGNAEVNTEIHGSVPAGTYTGVVFANGVPEALNHSNPTDPTNPPPLRTAYNLQWAWLSGYRFLKAEVSEVTDGGIPGAGKGVAHPGSQGCTGSPVAGSVTCARPNRNEVRLTNFDPSTNVIVADLGALFAHTDLTTEAQCHGTGEACPAIFQQLGIDYDAGTPLPTQAVYSVE